MDHTNNFIEKNVLVTGGTGMIGIPLVDLLIEKGARVRIVSMDNPNRAHPRAEFVKADLTRIENCEQVCKGMNYVFHLAAIKGSPRATQEHPATFFVANLLLNTTMAEAARLAHAQWYLYTSTVGVYPPAEIFREDDLWKGSPSAHDWFAGWAKRMGEVQLDAYEREYGLHNTSIIRPANVYGPYDNFNPANAMVVPSLIKRAMDGENPLTVWGDGSPIRDFVHARDVARAMLFAAENRITQPLNVASGKGITIKELVEIIISNLPHRPDVVWDASKPKGDPKRLMDVARITALGFKNQVSFEAGIKETMEWYAQHRNDTDMGYNIFTKSS